MAAGKYREVDALTVSQWLPGWDKIDFDPKEHRRRPDQRFYLFSLPARELRSLSGIVRREAKNAAPRTEDLGIQRQHDPERSDEISRFVEYGFPWSTLSPAKRASTEFNDLRKPGWLPTAVVINILTKGSERNNSAIEDQDLVTVIDEGGRAKLRLPYDEWSSEWRPAKLPPFEVIDGQHRLWAFDEASHLEGFELPVVAFVGLDISWQAYLWVPNALLPQGLQVMEAWGFRYISNIVWEKVRKDGEPDGRGVGYYFRNVTEVLLFGTRGKDVRTLAPGRTQVNIIRSRKREHSRKPDEQYDIIEACSWGPYLELFSRGKRAGWEAWGNQADEDYRPTWPTYDYNSALAIAAE